MSRNKRIYWWKETPEELGKCLKAKIDEYQDHPTVSEVFNRQAMAYRYAYGEDLDGSHATSRIRRSGDSGELARIRINHSRSLVQALLNVITAQKVVWAPKAERTGYEATRTCEIAKGLLDSYWTEKDVARAATIALEEALFFGESFLMLDWNPALGQPVAGIDGKLIRSGDVEYSNVSSWDVIRDPNKNQFKDCNWLIVRKRMNRYDVAALYPDFEDTILEISATDEITKENKELAETLEDGDDIDVYYYYHKATAAISTGRQGVVLNDGTVLQDSKLKTTEIPVLRVNAAEWKDHPYGYTQYFDVMGIQEAYDFLNSAIITNQIAFATQVVVADAGTDVSAEDITGGMRLITLPPQAREPRALQLTKSPPEAFQHLQNLEMFMEKIMGIPAVVRGQAPGADMAASAMALLHSQAVQQAAITVGIFHKFLEQTGWTTLELIGENLTYPQQLALSGKGLDTTMATAEYDGNTFKGIRKISIELGNPLQDTAAGRLQLAQDIMQLPGANVEQFFQVINTGNAKPMTESVTSELTYILRENEMIANGEQPLVLATDDAPRHILNHKIMGHSEEARKNPKVMQALLAHIQEHEAVWMGTPPQTLMLMGIQPPQPQMGPPPGASPGGDPAAMAAPSQPPQPSTPTNPATGQPWNPVDGGGSQPPPAAPQ